MVVINSKPSLKLLVASSVVTSIVPMVSVAENKVAIQVQSYQENDERIGIEDGKASIEYDFGPSHTLSTEVDWDTVSGASPTWDSSSGASQAASLVKNDDGENDLSAYRYQNSKLDDKRKSIATLYTYRTPTMRNELSLGLSYSKEEDFINTGISAEYLMYTDRSKNRAITVGAAFMKNKVEDRVESVWNEFDLSNIQVGITQVFNSRTSAKLNVFAMVEEGQLSNPYYTVPVRKQNEVGIFKYYLARDKRPSKRVAGGISSQVVRQMTGSTTWHLSYRYYQDNWSVNAHTLETKSYHNLGRKFRLSPGLRYYTQGSANFFKAHDADDNFFDVSDYASSDHRLGKYDSWTAQFSIDYLHSGDLSINTVVGHQAQSTGLSFKWVNFGVLYKY